MLHILFSIQDQIWEWEEATVTNLKTIDCVQPFNLSPLSPEGFIKMSPIPRLSVEVLINCGTCDPLHMRINNALWYLLFNLASQLHCTWQANLKERITVWVARGKGYRSLYKKRVPGCLYELECRKQNNFISNFRLHKRRRRNNSLFTWKSIWVHVCKLPVNFYFITRWWFVWQTFP